MRLKTAHYSKGIVIYFNRSKMLNEWIHSLMALFTKIIIVFIPSDKRQDLFIL